MPFSSLQLKDNSLSNIITSAIDIPIGSYDYFVNITSPTTVTLPANPNNGDRVTFTALSNLTTNTLTVRRNGNTINGSPLSLIIDRSNVFVQLVFFNGDWKLFLTF